MHKNLCNFCTKKIFVHFFAQIFVQKLHKILMQKTTSFLCKKLHKNIMLFSFVQFLHKYLCKKSANFHAKKNSQNLCKFYAIFARHLCEKKFKKFYCIPIKPKMKKSFNYIKLYNIKITFLLYDYISSGGTFNKAQNEKII